MRHAFIHAAYDDDQRHMGHEPEISQRRDAEGEGDRHADDDRRGDQTHEEDSEVVAAEREQCRLREIERPRHARRHEERDDELREAGVRGEAHQRARHHQQSTDGDRGGAKAVVNLEAGREDGPFLRDIVEGRPHDQQHEGHHDESGHGVGEAAPALRQTVDDGSEAHVLAAPQGDHRTEHGKPEKENGGELIAPGERAAEDVTRDHAR
jgi:hypothetical protein